VVTGRLLSMPLWLTVMASLEVGGGLLGLVLCVWLGARWIDETARLHDGSVTVPLLSYSGGTVDLVGLPAVILGLAFVAYGASIAAGLLVLRRRRLGLLMSGALLALQVPRFNALHVTYYLVVGCNLGLELRWPRLESWVFANVGSEFMLALKDGTEPMALGVNALPLLFIALLMPLNEGVYGAHADQGG
jgi:hypothetical protein